MASFADAMLFSIFLIERTPMEISISLLVSCFWLLPILPGTL